jgi:hypothetical protein
MEIRHEVTRLSIDVAQDHTAFCERFEAGVAAVGLRVFWRHERAGDPPATSYLVGNPVLVEQLYALDPEVLSVVPFHLAITGRPEGAARLTFDRPGTHLASFGGAAFAELAGRVDAKFAALLEQVGVEDHTTDLRAGPQV